MGRLTYVWVVAVAMSCAGGVAWAAEPRLDYRAEQSIKDAKFYLDRAERAAKTLEDQAAAMKVGDGSVQLGAVKQLLSTKDAAQRELGFAEVRLSNLPADHSKVKPQGDRVAAIKASLAASAEKLAAVQAGLEKVVAAGAGEGFRADFDRLREITRMYNNDFHNQPEAAVDIVKQMPAVRAERRQIAEKYADLLKQNTPQAAEMNGTLQLFDSKFGAFETEAKQYAADGPATVGRSIDQALQLAEDGAKNKKPLYFGEHGGINSNLARAETLYALLAAVAPDADSTKATRAKLDAAKARVAQMREGLLTEIVASNAPPAESYAGPDKDDLIALVKAKWAESGVKGDVLRVGINSTQWTRHARWASNAGGWYKVDVSRAQGFVIVKLDDKLAAIYHVDLSKDHLAGNKVTAYLFENPKDAPGVNQKMPLASVK